MGNTPFRNCTFSKARHVLFQAGDYVRVDLTRYVPNPDRYVPLAAADCYGGYDLSGLTFENCYFQSGYTSPVPEAYQVVGLCFYAKETFPLTLDRCFWQDYMAAGVEAYGGTMVVRGGTGQNFLTPVPYEVTSPTTVRRDRPRGGVDFFLGDPPVLAVGNAISPTGLSVFQFESQSDSLLDTFRHYSASAGKGVFFPTTLNGVSARKTQQTSGTEPVITWIGPGLMVDPIYEPGSTPGGEFNLAASLTLVGCKFRGPRPPYDVITTGATLPAGVIVVDKGVYMVSNVGTTLGLRSPSIFYAYDRITVPPTYVEVPNSGSPDFPWYRAL